MGRRCAPEDQQGSDNPSHIGSPFITRGASIDRIAWIVSVPETVYPVGAGASAGLGGGLFPAPGETLAGRAALAPSLRGTGPPVLLCKQSTCPGRLGPGLFSEQLTPQREADKKSPGRRVRSGAEFRVDEEESLATVNLRRWPRKCCSAAATGRVRQGHHVLDGCLITVTLPVHRSRIVTSE